MPPVGTPYSGPLVPAARHRKDERVLSVMVEVNRRLCMDETTRAKILGFERVPDG